ncbi:helix-turn-helix domain-containing protein [Kribbella sp. NPDC004138]
MDDHTVTGRVLAILDVLAETGAPTGLAKLTELTGIPKPSVRRIADDLVRRRLLERDLAGYQLGSRMRAFARTAERLACKSDLIRPFLHELHQRTGAIAWVAHTDATGYLAIADSAHDRPQGRFMAREWPTRFEYDTFPGMAGAQLVAVDHPEAMERVLRRGLPRHTARTITLPGRYEARVRQAAETGRATEYEEARLGWWCGAIRLGPPHDQLILGVTGQLNRTPVPQVMRRLEAARDPIVRELAAHAS